MADITLWGIHASRTGDADTLFLEQNVVAIGWQQLGDPSGIPANRNAFKTAFAKAYPQSKPGAVPTKAGQIFRFIHEMNRPGPERDRTDDDRQQHPLRTGRPRPGARAGGIGAMLLLARSTGLISDIDRKLHLLKRHLPYHESDHVLNIAFNILAGGRRIEHLELRRNDEVYLDALGAQRIPDPTTAGDFCRRFSEADVLTLMDAINRSAAAGLVPAARRLLRGGDPRRRRHPRRHRRRVQARSRHRLQRHLGLPSSGRSRWPTPPSRCTWSIAAATGPRTSRPPSTSTRRSTCAAELAFARSRSAATPTLPRPSTWTAGMTPAMSASSSASTRTPRSQGRCRGTAGPGLQLPGATAAVRDQDRAAPAARTGQGGDRRQRGFKTIHCSRRWSPSSTIARLPARRTIGWSCSASELGSDMGRCGCVDEYRYFFYITNDRDPGRRGRVPGQ